MVLSRRYKLYAKGNGPYEVVPTGYSILAAGLGPMWAIAYGLLVKYLLVTAVLFLPIVILSFLRQTLPPFFDYLALTYLLGAFYVYIPLVAFSWKEKQLIGNGYELKCSIVATSARNAFRKYAEST